MSEKRYSKYEYDCDKNFMKDGHTMFPQDIVKDLNRKSYLEKENDELRDILNNLEIIDGRVVVTKRMRKYWNSPFSAEQFVKEAGREQDSRKI